MGQDFPGTDRFEVQQLLGTGTSGEVYRCYDRKLGTLVALKTLHRGDPAAIYRFKREFRSLADVQHRNLVQLHELLCDGDAWFFTMELVDGLDFLAWSRTAVPTATGDFEAVPTPSFAADPARLRDGLGQLAQGLAALHDLGKLHCDIKPTNIRVDGDGRVVLLDFGLVREVFAPAGDDSMSGELAGTPAYMSPEQAAAGRGVGPPSDWYAVGVLLYEALTGRFPHGGGGLRMLTDKQRFDPPPPRTLAPDTPEDLDALCMRLLAREPSARPSGREVLRLVGAAPAPAARASAAESTHGSTGVDAPFLGRAAALGSLLEAFERARRGTAVVAFVHGSSGVGKTALVRRFLAKVGADDEEAVILVGRCYERESVPYKAFDSLVDALARYLRELPAAEAAALMPIDVLALARLFPGLRRVHAVAGAERRVLDIPDSFEQRRRAFAALRELLARLCNRHPLVLWIDDLQWGDVDSAALLAEILRPPDAPPFLLVSCYRREERETSPLLGRLFSGDLGRDTQVVEVELGPLPAEEAHELALMLLGERSRAARALATLVARESEGSPFFIAELVRHARARAGMGQEEDGDLSAEVERALARLPSVEHLLRSRIAQLSNEAARLLAVVAVAGRPVDLEGALQAAELRTETAAALSGLRGAGLARVVASREREKIETYHDRIRDTVLRSLPEDELRRLHLRLALALEGSGREDPETLAVHFLEAGERERAARFATAAADAASAALAFDRAARLYRIALDLDVETGEEQRRLRVRLGDALSKAGRGAEAAAAYLAAVEGAMAAETVELRRRAAEQQLISGHVDAGIATVQTVLASIGLPFPETPRRALLVLVGQHLRLLLRGLGFEEKDPTQIAADVLIAIDTCWSVATGLGTVDPIRGRGFAKRHLRLALEAGEPYRIARALAIESGYSASRGRRSAARTAALVHAATTLAERVGKPHALGLIGMTSGVAAFLEGKFKRAVEHLERSEAVLRERCTGVAWELDTAMVYALRADVFLGDLDDLRRRLPRSLEDVRQRGDLYAEVSLRIRSLWLHLADDDPERARREIDEAIARWTPRGFHVQHYWHLVGRVEIALYEGDGATAWEVLDGAWRRLERSLLLRIQFTRTEAFYVRGRAALAAACAAGLSSRDGRRLLAQAERQARAVERERLAWADPLAELLRAGIASVRGERDRAADFLVSAAAGLDRADLTLFAHAARLRRGQLLGRDRGRTLTQEATVAIAGQGVKDVARFADLLAPGLWS